MFARPRTAARVNRRHNLAEVEKSFTKVVGPAISQSTLAPSQNTPSTRTLRFNRTGDGLSYTYNTNDTMHVQKTMCQRGYRVLSYKEDRNGNRIVFDIIDGTVFNCSAGRGNRITNNAVIYDTKSAALSERFPSNQFGGSMRSGNGVHPRVLVAFDGWGQCRRRLGGGPSTCFETVKFMGIVEFLDPQHPVPHRQCETYVEPHYFTRADRQRPNRSVSDRAMKVDRSFNPNVYEPIL